MNIYKDILFYCNDGRTVVAEGNGYRLATELPKDAFMFDLVRAARDMARRLDSIRYNWPAHVIGTEDVEWSITGGTYPGELYTLTGRVKTDPRAYTEVSSIAPFLMGKPRHEMCIDFHKRRLALVLEDRRLTAKAVRHYAQPLQPLPQAARQ